MGDRFSNIIQLVRAIAPESVGNLNPPAGPDQIAKLLETVSKAGQVVEEDAECMRLRVIAASLNDLFEKYSQDIRNGSFHADDEGQIVNEDNEWPN